MSPSRVVLLCGAIAFGACFYACSAITSFDGFVGANDANALDATMVDGANTSDATGKPPPLDGTSPTTDGTAPLPSNIKTVFVIVLATLDESTLVGNSSAPYLNSLLTKGAHATNYQSVLGSLGQSLPCMIWLEAADNLGVTDDADPSQNAVSTTTHLTNELASLGVTWKSYEEGITGAACPLADTTDYLVHHDPFVYFDDVSDNQDVSSQKCITHIRPYSELAGDLSANTQPQYIFIVPSRCHDMHDDCLAEENDAGSGNPVKPSDTWLLQEVPKILASNAMKTGALFIVWDHPAELADTALPFLVLSPFAKVGYAGSVRYDHSSFVRSIETIFGAPPIRAAASANDLSDLFTAFP